MPDIITTTNDVAPAVAIYYDRVLLEATKENMVFSQFAQHATQPAKSGNIHKWHRYPNPSAALTPLPEGEDGNGRKVVQEAVTAKVQFYGGYEHIVEEVDVYNQDPVLTQSTERNGYQAELTFETLMRDILAASASMINASGGNNGNTPTEITRGDINTAVSTLLGGGARFITKMVMAGSGIGSSPLRPSLRSIIHQELLMDLENCTGFMSVANYASQNGVTNWEWGNVGNVRFDWTTNAHKSTDATAIYNIPIFGADAYGDVSLEGIKSIMKGFDRSGSILDRYATNGWKHAWGGRVLNDAHILNLRVTKDT